jgi:uncharacterized repeat protein (TIGR01451 family)
LNETELRNSAKTNNMKKLFLIAGLLLNGVMVFASGHTLAVSAMTNVSCFGGTDGAATISVSGGVGPFTYSWSPSGGTTATQTGLAAGTYTVTVTDMSDNSTASIPVTINQPTALVSTTPGGMNVCAGQAITFFAAVSGGTPAYTYNWSPSAGLSSVTVLNPICVVYVTTSYTLTVTDANGCTTSSVLTLFVDPPMTIGITTQNTTCGLCDGQATAVVSGGNPPYTYTWSITGGTAPTTTNLCGASYTVTITDANGCTATDVATINSVPSISDVFVSVTNASCGNADGFAVIDSIHGGVAPYTYLWSPSGATGSTFTNLAAGIYNLTVMDSLSCSYSEPVVISNIAGPASASITTVNTNCTANTGQVNIGTVTGGVSPYTYSFNGGAFTSTTSYTGLGAGVYMVQIEDAGGCIYTTLATVNQNNPPVIALDSVVDANCSGSVSGGVYVSVSAGTSPYSYVWSNGTNSEDMPGVTPGTYVLTVTDASGCVATHSYNVHNNSVFYASVSQIPGNCGTLASLTVTPYGGTAPYTYSWNTVPVQTTATATGLSNGTYSCLVTDNNGCTVTIYAYAYSGCYNVIKGTVYDDANSNCVKDPGENGLAGRNITATGSSGSFYGYTDANGNYSILTLNMNNTVTVNYPYYVTYYSPTCPATGTQNVNFSVMGDTLINNNFGLYINPSYFDLNIHPGWSSANPGFQKHYWCLYGNASPTSQNVLIRFVYDSALVYNSCTMGGVHYPAQHKIEWSFGAVAPNFYSNWFSRPEAFFTVPATMSITANLNTYFEILPITGDANPSDNTLMIIEPVTGARDPNSKSVIPEGEGPNGNIFVSDSVLMYTIHFQNNGNDTAHFVIVKDTLSEYLDPATIVPGAASHPYTFELSAEGILTFTFNDIMLPDSLTDEPGSNGYFNYTIKQKANNPVGTVIENRAGIYFDYNLPVMTNTTVNTIVDVTTGIDLVTQSSNAAIKVYPNPFSDQTTFIIQSEKLNEIYSFEMLDMLGRNVKAVKNISEKQFSISRNDLQNGMYFYRITSAEGVVGSGKLIIK